MRKSYVSGLAALLFVSVVLESGSAELKIAVVAVGRVLNAYDEMKSAENLIEKQVEEFELEQKEMFSELESLKEEFDAAREEAGNKALSEEIREEKKKIAEEKFAALKKCERQIQETLGLRQKQIADQGSRMRRRILSKLRDIIQEYAEKESFDLVFDSSGIGVGGMETIIYGNEKMDITEEILKLIAKKEE